jgi:formylglycine-generating enzyme required for sulfatase activity
LPDFLEIFKKNGKPTDPGKRACEMQPLPPSPRIPTPHPRVGQALGRALLLGTLLAFPQPGRGSPDSTSSSTPSAIEWVTIGNPNNPPDATGFGSVARAFQIGRFEVTAGQYVEFLNAVAASDPHRLWKPEMGEAVVYQRHTALIQRTGAPGSYRYQLLPNADSLPVNFVTVADAMRFANWLHNGMGPADTENGAYLLAEGRLPETHLPEAKFWVPTENEWYKAAYHHPAAEGGPQSHYWLYPTRSMEPPRLERRGGSAPQSASFLDLTLHDLNYAFLNPVGSHPLSPSHYGTFDQGGSVWEWTETPRLQNERVLRGGSVTKPAAALRAVMRLGCRPNIPQRDVGFRLARRLPETAASYANSGPIAPGFPHKAMPLFDAHCMDCHDADTHKGGLDLSSLAWNPQDPENFARWIRVFDKVDHGEMPPPQEKRPAPALRAEFTQSLRAALHTHSLQQQQRQGRVVYRRLNRAEYQQTIRDLFDVNTPIEDLLPADPSEGGFDTIGNALHLSAAHLERYLETADTLLRDATLLYPKPPSRILRTDLSDIWLTKPEHSQHMWSFSPEGFLAIRAFRGRGVRDLDWSPEVPDALYRFKVRARAMLDDAGDSGGAGKAASRVSPERKGQGGLRLNNLWPQTGPDPRMTLSLGISSRNASGTVLHPRYYEASPTEFRDFIYEARVPRTHTLQIAPYRIIPDQPGQEGGKFHGMCAVIESIEIEGPLFEIWPPRGHRLLYGDLPLRACPPRDDGSRFEVASSRPEDDARRILATALPKLFRRPVSDSELQEVLAPFQEQTAKGTRFDEALRESFKLALCSPEFLFLRETPGRLDDFALASRLSYGLWSSTPDDTLLELARQGSLHSPEVLRQQTERLLNDPRSARFARHFLANWLNLRDIDATQPDTKLFTEFEGQLQDAMLAESEAFWRTLVQENLDVSHIVHSDFAMLNERLAEHYGIPGVRGDTIRKVALDASSPRGGFLTQGAVLKVSANGTLTSPVVRGAYVLERILGTPPEPPPKGVPAIEPDIRGATTIRAQLEKHRSDAACSVCHAKMDPPGFALESFDVTGRWRTHYRILGDENRTKTVTLPGDVHRLFLEGPKVDPSATMADGFAFGDIRGFKERLRAQPEVLARALTEKLVSQLTGARPQFADREEIEALVQTTRAEGFGVRTLIHAVIQSRLFTHK